MHFGKFSFSTEGNKSACQARKQSPENHFGHPLGIYTELDFFTLLPEERHFIYASAVPNMSFYSNITAKTVAFFN